jgi:uridine kinase
MITVTISGPQGSGTTTLCKMIVKFLDACMEYHKLDTHIYIEAKQEPAPKKPRKRA